MIKDSDRTGAPFTGQGRAVHRRILLGEGDIYVRFRFYLRYVMVFIIFVPEITKKILLISPS